MKVSQTSLKSMSVAKLTALRDEVDAVLGSKVAEERRAIQEQISRLDRLAGGPRVKGPGRRQGPIPPKYVNPDNPAETWAGRGLKPRWLQAALKGGMKLEDFSVDAPKSKLRGRRKKTQGA